ncbi:protoporphyrinogen oxidase [Edaphobacter dinghuensis]|uniref:Coproporphyrinogen III oxidase n=1 Tax=Edaphobacter dinghuensis TaxID=1560005 RepID=A0A917MBD4_9BACT|nr:protoporphyrinogen oxidase [Edaphobacter dinghuensis]GGG89314.1 protoporphyrinogen oxidase [Edaphobacter dinghuensis]
MKRIAIIGGGIAGLTAAYELSCLASKGAAVEAVLFEASPRLGGIVETVREGGFVIECGPDAWVTEKPWARELAEQLGLGDEIISSNDATRKTYVLMDGLLQAMPDGMRMMVPANLHALDQSELFSPEAKQDFHAEISRATELKASAPQHDESVAAFVRRHFGDEVLDTIGAPLLRGVFGGDVTQLSVRAVMAPFVAMEREHGSLIAAMQANSTASKSRQAAIFTTLQSGLGTLVDRMVATIPKDWLRLGTTIRALSHEHDGWKVETSSTQEHFDVILMAAPVHIARELMQSIDTRAAQLIAMDASSAVVVAFGFPDATGFSTPPGFGFLVPEGSGSRLLACTFVDQKFANRVPPNGKLIRAFFGADAAERLIRCGNDEVSSVARLELAHILGPLPEPQVTVVRRWPKSLPQYAVGHLERMKELDEHIRNLNGLYLLGNGYRGVGLPDLIRDARAAAQQLV